MEYFLLSVALDVHLFDSYTQNLIHLPLSLSSCLQTQSRICYFHLLSFLMTVR
jgi:hypothetical protein